MPDPPPSELETELLIAIRQFFEARQRAAVPDQRDETAVTSRKLQLATAVLFLQMISADQKSKHDEHQALIKAVAEVLRIDGPDAVSLVRLAEEHVRTPLPQLLKLMNERCTEAQLKTVITHLWQLAFADAELEGHEEYYVRKVAQALHLTTADLIETKIRAREAFR